MEGRTEREWVDAALSALRPSYPGLPALKEFEAGNAGVYAVPVTKPAVAFADFRRDPGVPAAHAVREDSYLLGGAARARQAGRDPAAPEYIQEWESPFGPEARRFPLQVVGHHSLARVHSTMSGVDWLEEAFPQRAFVNPADAAARSIANGDTVRVFNDRGELTIKVPRDAAIMPGVVAIPQGAWWTPNEKGVDTGGSVNVLTSERWTPLAFGNAQHTVMAEVAKAQDSGLKTQALGPRPFRA